ncbi:aminopeptidase P N-terminal domain-containing protein [Agromyces sp. NPDC058110]|uniref:aminopeptidase P N-terminal domain-containing protein n=1 Tax=Agromyces sp. NPDC058110 TaxID=3346345 RepID=UPI0036D8C752
MNEPGTLEHVHPVEAPAAASMPTPETRDPRLPRLREVPAFLEYMATGWEAPDRTPPVEPGVAAASAAHRARLSAALPGRTIVVEAGRAPVRANDSYYGFRPDSDFFWLSGCDAEDAVVVLTPAGSGHDATLFVPAPAYPGDPDFFANAAHGELWVGSAPGAPDWAAALEIEVQPLERLADLVRSGDDVLRFGTATPSMRPSAASVARRNSGACSPSSA